MSSTRTLRRKQKGQAMILIAGAILGLFALVALAVDGGNAYAQRRIAQNAVDGGANGGITTMNQAWHTNYNLNTHTVNPMTIDQNHAVLAAIVNALTAVGADTRNTADGGTFEAWYTGCDGQRYGTSQIGTGFQQIPFCGGDGTPNSPGARGVWVRTTKSDGTYFARVIGIDHVSADAFSAAEIGTPGGDSPRNCPPPCQGPKLWPITIMQDTVNIEPGHETSLYEFRTTYAPGNWGVLDFTGTPGGARDIHDWLRDGFNVQSGDLQLSTSPDSHDDLQHYSFYPIGWDGVHPNTDGVWQPVQTGNGGFSRSCDVFQDAVNQHWHVFMPISTATNGETGNGLRYKVVNIAEFEVHSFDCNGSHNTLSGQFVGYTWDPGQAVWSDNLSKALINKQTITRLSR